ncbi:THAP domain-containing 1-like [Pelobates cultripes]|uniref:THAP domain-containing 1-like n=1 Tax=Pelobates cultripes TaxID=61616 RepID=A0AAD1WF82_PELCU|nr:THAP domain-containing 1-like [Pelobates cultripes]
MTCAACGCNSRYLKESGKQFFSFPIKDRDRFEKWIASFQHRNWKPSDTLCSDHFTENDFTLLPGTLVPCLRTDAVPSVFSVLPDNDKKLILKRRNPKKIQKSQEKSCNAINSDDKLPNSEASSPGDHVDHNYSVACSETENDIPFSSLNPGIMKLKRKIRRLTRRAQRQKYKIQTMKEQVKKLKRNNLMSKQTWNSVLIVEDF